jgi:ABC-2 type transport system permease protein
MGLWTGFRLLLGVKLRLLLRSFARRSVGQTILLVLVLAGVLVPSWNGLGGAARAAVTGHGVTGAVAVLGAVHLGWLFSSFLFSAFAEGFELRRVLRYPVRPAAVFVLNVLLAPVDLVALFLLPPLVATVTAMGRLHGPGAAVGMALGCGLTVLVTGVVLHILLAALGRFLKREWMRALAGLLFGLAFAAPSLAFNRHIGTGQVGASLDRRVPAAAQLAERLPTTFFPALLVRGAAEGRPGPIVAGLLGAALVLVLGVALGTRWAVAAALTGETGGAPDPGEKTSGVARAGPFERMLGADVAVLVGRELRYWLRTPQVVLGLLVTPLMVLFFFREHRFAVDLRLFFLPFLCLVSVFNVSANQFGLDREGVRLLFLLPIAPRRLIAAKNLASLTVVTVETVVSLILVRLVGGAPGADLGAAALSVVATIPAVLMAGNALSVRHPWRMTFRVGGTPPGALASAFTQIFVVAAMAFLLAIPTLVGRFVGGRLISLAGTALLGVLAWTVWSLSLGRAARGLSARREQLLATLAHPHETG